MCEATTAADVVFQGKLLGGRGVGKPRHRIRYKSSILIALIQRFPRALYHLNMLAEITI